MAPCSAKPLISLSGFRRFCLILRTTIEKKIIYRFIIKRQSFTVLWTLSFHLGHQSTLKPIPCCYCTQSEFQITISFQILVRSLATFLFTQGKVGEWNTITTTTTTTRTIGKFNKRSYTDMLLLCITNKTTSTTDREHKSFGSGIHIDKCKIRSTIW